MGGQVGISTGCLTEGFLIGCGKLAGGLFFAGYGGNIGVRFNRI